jgi:hypothetical protein
MNHETVDSDDKTIKEMNSYTSDINHKILEELRKHRLQNDKRDRDVLENELWKDAALSLDGLFIRIFLSW